MRGVHAGSCYAWPLPADATCATVARQVFRERADPPASDMSVLSACRDLAVWCRSGMVYEELELGLDLAAAGA